MIARIYDTDYQPLKGILALYGIQHNPEGCTHIFLG